MTLFKTVMETKKVSLPDENGKKPFLNEVFVRNLIRFLISQRISPHNKPTLKLLPREFSEDLPPQLEDLPQAILKNIHYKDLNPLPKLPKSARPFFIFHEESGRYRYINDFQTTLICKIEQSQTFKQAVEQTQASVTRLKDNRMSKFLVDEADYQSHTLYERLRDNFSLYNRVSEEHISVYKQAIKKLDSLPPLIEPAGDNLVAKFAPEIYHGRDARGIYIARKARMFGKKTRVLIYVLTTRNIICHRYFTDYLVQSGVTIDGYHIDSGFQGSTPNKAIVLLAEKYHIKLESHDINQRIKLLSSSHSDRESLIPKKSTMNGAVGDIEATYEFLPVPNNIVKKRRKRFIIKYYDEDKYPKSKRISAWTVEQAVMRYFVPKFNHKYYEK